MGFSSPMMPALIEITLFYALEVLTRFTRSSASAIWLAKAVRIRSCSWVMTAIRISGFHSQDPKNPCRTLERNIPEPGPVEGVGVITGNSSVLERPGRNGDVIFIQDKPGT